MRNCVQILALIQCPSERLPSQVPQPTLLESVSSQLENLTRGYLLIQLKVYSCGNDEELDKMVNKDVIKKMDNEMGNGLELMVEEVGWKQMKMA